MTGIGTITAAEVFSERVDLQPRTSDPSNTEEGEGWVRSDVTPKTDQIGTLRFDTGSGTVDLPIFDAAASTGSDIETHLRVPVGGTQGFVPTTNDGAAYPSVGVWDSGTRFGAHDSLSAIPDTSMFQSPLYQYTAVEGLSASDGQTATNWTEQLAGAGDASAVNSPVYRSEQAGFKAVEYNGSTDGHDYPSDGNLPTGDSVVSFAATVYAKSLSSFQTVVSYGDNQTAENPALILNGTNVRAEIRGGGNAAEGGSPSTDQWLTIGGVMATDDVEAYLDGSSVATNDNTDTANFVDAGRSIGYRGSGDATYASIYVYDVVVCDARESTQAFSDYHNDRLG